MIITKNGKYIKENWKEWFRADIGPGYRTPSFFIPIRMKPMQHLIESWVFPLAPFALFYYIFTSAFWKVWRDFITFLELLSREYTSRKPPIRILLDDFLQESIRRERTTNDDDHAEATMRMSKIADEISDIYYK